MKIDPPPHATMREKIFLFYYFTHINSLNISELYIIKYNTLKLYIFSTTINLIINIPHSQLSLEYIIAYPRSSVQCIL